MTIEADPNSATPRTLSRPGLSEDQAPVVYCYAPRLRQQRKIMPLAMRMMALTEGTDPQEADQAVEEAIELVKSMLAGWKNVTDHRGEPIEFSPDAIEDGLKLEDIMSLLFYFAGLTDDEKKDSGSPSPSSAEESTQPAASSS